MARQYGQRTALYETLQIAGREDEKALREVERILTVCRENLFVDNQIAGAREHVLGLAARKDEQEAPAVTIRLRPPIPVPLSHAEVVVLDGTGNPDQYKALFAPGQARPPAERDRLRGGSTALGLQAHSVCERGVLQDKAADGCAVGPEGRGTVHYRQGRGAQRTPEARLQG